MSDLFLLDSNIFIESYRTHHPFSYKEFHPFWRWLERMAHNGKIQLLDTVFKEITQKDSDGNRDELAEWAFNLFSDKQLSHKTDEIGVAYAQVQDYLATCGLYRPASYRQWEPETKADPWLIAAAMVEDAIVVTNEQAVHPMPSSPLKKEPKIPDVADAMGVRTMNLREFYDASGELVSSPYPIQPTL
ncbi:DUF4411 family protein [Bifidobacterium sp. CP2]|uniref:DUF4411 family protein n=1 Tax=Bifidobacterium sp. CP2 TaxID=2809025 RepID=UPI001BDCE0CB|nr:DUF4411 family protein [Bifidobacterium sp. CP2]